QADVFEWRPAERFDLVFFSFWLSHVPEERFDQFWSVVRSALLPGGRVFLVDSGPLGDASNDERQVRQLADGREFTIIKRYWSPAQLVTRMRPLGFELDVRVTKNRHFLYGGGSATRPQRSCSSGRTRRRRTRTRHTRSTRSGLPS